MARAPKMGVITFIIRNHSGIQLFSGKRASTGKVKREQTLCFLRLITVASKEGRRAGTLSVTPFDLNGELRQIAVMWCIFRNKATT